MADIDAIIEQVLAASRRKGGRAFASQGTYGDELILVRGSRLASYRPEPVRQMRDLARSPEARSWSDARLFVEQARLMEAYEDDCPYHGTFTSYFPTYQAMSDQQLRGYFTWRAHVRRGEVEETSASFAYVYLYELINGIGVRAGRAGFEAIRSFWEAYRAFEPAMDRYARAWLVDYAVYHDLDPALALPYVNAEHDRAVGVLAREEAAALAAPAPRRGRQPRDYGTDPEREARLFDALCQLSTYRVPSSRLYRDNPDDLRAVSCAVFDRLARHYRSGRTQALVASLFGTRHPMPHLMFASAVFWPGGRHADCTYELGETRTYECRGGIWSCDALHDGGGRSEKLGQVMQAVDRRLRDALGHPSPLKSRGEPKYLARIIDREVEDYLAWRLAHAPRRVEIDLSKLDGIRSAAAETRESLLVDEEREGAGELEAAATPGVPERPGTAQGQGAPAPAPSSQPGRQPPSRPAPEPPAALAPAGEGVGGHDEPASGGAGPLDLSAEERELLRALLAGAPAGGSPATDLLVDSINERLLDLVGDTVVEFGDDGSPALVEDYRDEVLAALGE